MVPLYLPHVLDDAPADPEVPVFLGGINLFLQEKFALFRHAPRWVERLLDSDRLLRLAASRAGMTAAADLGRMVLGSFRATGGHQAKEWGKLVAWIGTQSPRPDLVSLSNGLLIGVAKAVKQQLGIPVVCALQGEDTFLDALPEPWRARAWDAFREEAAHVDGFVPVSRYYGNLMSTRLGLEPGRVHPVLNGIDLAPFAPAAHPPDRPAIGYLARLHHCKGLHTAVDAFIELKRRGRHPGLVLRVAGAMVPDDRPYVAEQQAKLERDGLAADAEILPNIDLATKVAFLQSLSAFTVPATYGESFGLYVIEALACGVPVVQPDHGAFPEVLGRSGGGKLCPPDDATALADVLENLLDDPAAARALGAEGRAGVLREFGVERMAREFAAACAGVLAADTATAG
jgi:glycosyltransferase involved in cell wall biosynthesis